VIRTVLFYCFFWAYIIGTLFFFIPVIILSVFKHTIAKNRIISFLAKNWAHSIIKATGSSVQVFGKENIPVENNICFIANHQGGFDIPLIMGYIPKSISFIAKKELRFLPIIGQWMMLMPCVFIDRSSSRKSVVTIQKGAEQIKKGNPVVIFPEGTRSRSSNMADFKAGSLKLAFRSDSYIVPVTIDGSYKIREENKGIITPADVKITIHTPIDTTRLSDEEKKKLAPKLWNIINSALEKNSC